MGEAKRRSQSNPTFGKVPRKFQEIRLQLCSALSEYQRMNGRGFYLTDAQQEDGWLVYIRQEQLNANHELKQAIAKANPGMLGQLMGTLENYDLEHYGVHVHFGADETDVSLYQFPLALINEKGALDQKAVAIAMHFLAIGGARIVEVGKVDILPTA